MTDTTKVGFHIPATFEVDGHLSEEEAIEKLVEHWDEATPSEKLALVDGVSGADLAENLAFIDHKRDDGCDEVVAEW